MFAKTHRTGDGIVVGISFSEGKFFLVDNALQRILLTCNLQANCEDCFDLSEDKESLVVGYSYSHLCGVEVINLKNQKPIEFIETKRMYGVGIDRSGRYVLFKGDQNGVEVYDRITTNKMSLKYCKLPLNGDRLASKNEYIIPWERKNTVSQINFGTWSEKSTSLPTKGEAWLLRASPDGSSAIVLGNGGRIASIDTQAWTIKWKLQLSDASWLCISGDGNLIGIEERDGRKVQTTVVETLTGKKLNCFPGVSAGRSPLTGSLTLESSGEIVDLATGVIRDGVSKPAWWRAHGIASWPE